MPEVCRCAPSVVSHALCLIAISLLLEQCLFPVATSMNFVATWDLLTITKLCRDLKFSSRDLVSTAYTPLYHDKDKSCSDIRFLVAFILCRDTEELCRDTIELCRDMRFSFTPVPCRDLKTYVTTKKIPSLRKPLS